MQKLFKLVNIVLAILLLLSSIGHIALLLSDSHQYRLFVITQIVIQLLAIVSLFGIQQYKPLALISFSFLSVVFFIINSAFINYGMFTAQLIVFIIFWCIYGSFLYNLKREFGVKYA
jgi:hypothetical protein